MKEKAKPSSPRIPFAFDERSSKPRFRQIQDALLKHIADGVIGPGDRLPPLRQWADEVGVAYETMSKAIRELVAAGVLEARPKWGTRVAPRGVNARRRVGAIGVIVTEYYHEFLKNSRFYGRLVPMLQDELMKQQERVTFERWEPGMAMPEMFGHLSTVDGVVLMGNVRYPVEGILAVEELGVPVLFVGGELMDLRIHVVRSDDFTDCREAVKELAAKGHREIAAVTGPEDLRALGYDRGLIEMGLPRRPEFLVTENTPELMVRRFEAMKVRPTALLMARHLSMAGDLVRGLNKAGWRVGTDLHICMYDDDLWNQMAPLGIPYSRIEQPVAGIAAEAARIMLGRIEGRYDGPTQVMFRSKFVPAPARA